MSASECPSTPIVVQTKERQRLDEMGWGRAILTTAIIAVVGIAVLVYLPNLVLLRVHGIARGGRVAVATTIFAIAVVSFGWVLRKLQHRGII